MSIVEHVNAIAPRRNPSWSRDAVIYQIYVRSFGDSDGDGVGDLNGITSRLDYLRDLGVDALWLTPFYRSPLHDGGYDVADYRDVHPLLGNLAAFDRLLAQAHERDLRIIIDIVPNHTSIEHRWFAEALAGGPGSPARQRFHFRSGGDTPPNNWQSMFRGSAWTRLPDGDWYLHLFAPQQPDLNWEHSDVRAEFAEVLRFWLDRGVDGIRIDVAHGMVKAPGLPDSDETDSALLEGARTPFFDQDGVHEIYRSWRRILDSYQPERIAVAEAWLPNVERTSLYVRPDELHQAFNFEFLTELWSGPGYRDVIERSLAAMSTVDAPATWVLSNHDVIRHASRLASESPVRAGGVGGEGLTIAGGSTVGLRRARAATLLMLALPGSVYLYQGEELGLPEVLDLPASSRQDPIFARTGGAELGRDGCRVPLPWSGSSPPFGFGPDGSTPWLPQPAAWAGLTAEAQRDDPTSTLSMYRDALRLRRTIQALGDGELRWLSSPGDEVLVLERPGRPAEPGRPTEPGQPGQPGVICAVNLSAETVPAPVATPPLLASGPLDGTALPPDTAVWWSTSQES